MRAKILVVEDNLALRDQIAVALAFNDYEVILASDGIEGLEKAQLEHPHLVVSDIMMPGGSGLEMVRQIRSHAEIAAVPVVLISARVAAKDVREGMNLGADDYLTKPFHLEELLRTVEARLSRHESSLAHRENVRIVESSQLLHSLPSEVYPPLGEIVAMSAYLRSRLEVDVCLPGYGVEIISAIERAGIKLQKVAESLVLHFELSLAKQNSSRLSVPDRGKRVADLDVLRSTAIEVATSYGRSPDLLCQIYGGFVIAMSPEDFRRAIGEIVDNAFKFSSPGTQVEIRVEHVDGCAVITVLDRGTGMTEYECAHMEAFCQWRRGTERPAGLGLGFSNASGLFRLAGGHLTITERPGGGCAAVMKVPAAAPLPSAESANLGSPASAAEG